MFHGPSDAFLLMFGQQRSVSGSGRAQQSLVMCLPGAPMLSSVCVNVSAAGGQLWDIPCAMAHPWLSQRPAVSVAQ